MVKLLYFARLREVLEMSSEQVDLPAGAATVEGLTQWLRGRGGVWAEALAPEKTVRVAVNQDMADAGTAVADGDEVAFFPPVTGG